ncbi:unnamed protein product [Cylindrotheca closterium]|uniref:EF-hand domain-containing protein n=1 Tax=Cylindrotheca closterium TaxID=2856 RepID=A0AAD2FZ71_9STRA|nr:unnamed protein product [Cylindrotheca closterium]
MFAAKEALQAFTKNARTASPMYRAALRPAARGALSTNATSQVPSSVVNWNSEPCPNTFSTQFVRGFATAAPMGTVSRPLEKLDMATVGKIQAELGQVDTNEDGRLDADELSELLKKHHSEFTNEEIMEARDMFYAGRAGGSISFADFIEVLDKIAAENKLDHPILNGSCSAEYIYRKNHHYTNEELQIELTHVPPQNMRDKLAYNAVKAVRGGFDMATGWQSKGITKDMVMQRVIFLETIAAVPGFVAAIVRHFKSLRRMERDGGLLQLFLEEANNERMHLLSFIKMKNPGKLFRGAVIVSQFGFGTAFLTSYAISPKFCHRFVGYVEEEACSTYTKIIDAIEKAPEGSELAEWRTEKAPSIAVGYWELGEHGTVLDLMYAVRADEAEHRDVNHVATELKLGQTNPYNDPEMKLSIALRKYVQDVMSRDDDTKVTATA